MNTATRVAAAAASGYILGRRKRLKLAIAVGSMLAGKRLATDPKGMLRQANELIESRPELAKLSDQVRTTLFMAARGAAVGVVSNRINAVSDSIRDRSDLLTGAVTDKVPIGRGSDEADERESDENEPDERDTDEREADEREPEDTKDERPRPRKRPAKKAASSRSDAPARKRTAAKKTTATKKTAAAKKTAKKSATKKSASSGRTRSGSRG
ncbi:hypothetical protein [Jiangella mangrovi]|uniref:Outer membrane biosynthesis protein TonB n=1 Tax=Jiangella mangrovi TaxID=1524084 RepID=A0A7W9GSK8_9ACTN|nr:hypothetical protein [Jiangella mangrovi]MBB5789290.1 outer membrane biosynthesis protein TonB [Jiangella mangrovi]